MQNESNHFFIIAISKMSGHRCVSPIAFPEKEAKRRQAQRKRILGKDWRFELAPAPTSHPRWNKDFRTMSSETHCKRVALGQRLLEEHKYYGLKEAKL